jgi:hypothetical protein
MNRKRFMGLAILTIVGCGEERDSLPNGPPGVSLQGRVTLGAGLLPTSFSTVCFLLVPQRHDPLIEVCQSQDSGRGLSDRRRCEDPSEVLIPMLEPDGAYQLGRQPTLTSSTSTTTRLIHRWRAAIWLSPRPDGIPEQPWALGLSRWVEVEAMDCPPTVAGPCFGAFANDADIVIEGDQPPCP